MEEIRNIVFAGLEYGRGKKNIIKQIKLKLANAEEAEELTEKAESLYKEYRAEYYILK